MTRLRVIALVILAVFLVAGPAAAATPRTSFNDIEDEVMCDVCNVPLNIAEAPRADQQRREIRGLIAGGLTKEEIKNRLVSRYGPAILATPERRGFALAAYLVPIAVVVGLVIAGAVLLPRWRRRAPGRPPGEAPTGPDLSTADTQRLDDDLARYRL